MADAVVCDLTGLDGSLLLAWRREPTIVLIVVLISLGDQSPKTHVEPQHTAVRLPGLSKSLLSPKFLMCLMENCFVQTTLVCFFFLKSDRKTQKHHRTQLLLSVIPSQLVTSWRVIVSQLTALVTVIMFRLCFDMLSFPGFTNDRSGERLCVPVGYKMTSSTAV